MTRRTKLWLLFVVIWLAVLSIQIPVWSQPSIYETIREAHRLLEQIDEPSHQTIASIAQARIDRPRAIDVTHYHLQIELTPDPPRLAGAVTIEGRATAPVEAIQIDAYENLIIDAVRSDGIALPFQRTADRIILGLPHALSTGESFTITVDYHGVPVTSGVLGGGMLVARHGAVYVMANLSEPYAAPTWWPCIDHPSDKATIDIEAVVPRAYVAASNGVLERVEPVGNRKTRYVWREEYPIATYLVSVAATNYVQFEDSYIALDGRTTMPLVYYVYPEHLAAAQQKFPVTRSAMEIFAPLFGEYPFLAEKYGMVEFPWGGAMEHQTMTSMGDRIVHLGDLTVQDFISHELAHQWWGDWVTLATWHDIWLNEGFATYSEVLFFERFYGWDPGELMDRSYDDHRAFGRMGGTVYAEDLENPFDDSGAIYTKGAWVLHMLRHILGEREFFAMLKDYGRRFAFANASTEDFQRVCEDYYGAPMDWFFQQWIFAPGRPIYHVEWEVMPTEASDDYTVLLSVEQVQPQRIPGRPEELERVYIMPIDITLHYDDGSSEMRVIWNDARRQEFTFVVPRPPTRIGFDEGHWVLKEVR